MKPMLYLSKEIRIFFVATAVGIALPVMAEGSAELRPFKTDYCTNYPEGTRANPQLWRHCCLLHDMYFWAGGSKQDRYDSDLALRSCIEATGAYRVAKLMFYAVRAGAHSPYKYPDKKWGNGWPGRQPFQALSVDEIQQIEAELSSGYDFISPELRHQFLTILNSRAD